jgi:hypothetical protein
MYQTRKACEMRIKLRLKNLNESDLEKSNICRKKNSVVLVRKRTMPIERSSPVSEASANFSG